MRGAATRAPQQEVRTSSGFRGLSLCCIDLGYGSQQARGQVHKRQVLQVVHAAGRYALVRCRGPGSGPGPSWATPPPLTVTPMIANIYCSPQKRCRRVSLRQRYVASLIGSARRTLSLTSPERELIAHMEDESSVALAADPYTHFGFGRAAQVHLEGKGRDWCTAHCQECCETCTMAQRKPRALHPIVCVGPALLHALRAAHHLPKFYAGMQRRTLTLPPRTWMGSLFSVP